MHVHRNARRSAESPGAVIQCPQSILAWPLHVFPIEATLAGTSESSLAPSQLHHFRVRLPASYFTVPLPLVISIRM